MLQRRFASSICALLLLFGGCPKRKGAKYVVVYVPAPAPAATQTATAPAAAGSQVLQIEEPAPPPKPEPEEAAPPPPPEPTVHRPQVTRHAPKTAGGSDEAPEEPPAEVPALEPRESSAQETELRRQYLNLQRDIGQRLERLRGARLSPSDRRTLEDARAFYAQATHAMASGDLPRALTLARKASLLLAALQ
jgi:hypothetical protein